MGVGRRQVGVRRQRQVRNEGARGGELAGEKLVAQRLRRGRVDGHEVGGRGILAGGRHGQADQRGDRRWERRLGEVATGARAHTGTPEHVRCERRIVVATAVGAAWPHAVVARHQHDRFAVDLVERFREQAVDERQRVAILGGKGRDEVAGGIRAAQVDDHEGVARVTQLREEKLDRDPIFVPDARVEGDARLRMCVEVFGKREPAELATPGRIAREGHPFPRGRREAGQRFEVDGWGVEVEDAERQCPRPAGPEAVDAGGSQAHRRRVGDAVCALLGEPRECRHDRRRDRRYGREAVDDEQQRAVRRCRPRHGAGRRIREVRSREVREVGRTAGREEDSQQQQDGERGAGASHVRVGRRAINRVGRDCANRRPLEGLVVSFSPRRTSRARGCPSRCA